MKKRIVLFVGMALLACFLFNMGIVTEYAQRKENIIRLHVVGASDAATDQEVKLLVRDAVISCIADDLAACENAQQAGECIVDHLSAIETAAEKTLRSNGFQESVRVTFCKEAFPVRTYDSFSLPSGVYQALRVQIGKAEGRNWWCVVFPSFCYDVSAEGFQDTAVGSGFSQPLTDTLSGESEYKISFLLLDLFGRLENFFHLG